MAKSEKSRRWIIVVNNYTPQDEEIIQAIHCRYIVYGKEVGESGTPHLQGFIIFNSTKTLVACKKLHATAHFQIAVKSSEINRNYAKKGEQTKAEWNEHHDDGPNFGLNYNGYENGDFPDQPGKRTDLDEIKEAIEGGMTNPRDLRKYHSAAYSNHRRFCTEYIVDHKPCVELEPLPLRPWQQEVESILDGPIDQRKIIFVVDPIGAAGKSWFVEYYRQLHPTDTIVSSPGKKADMVYAAAANGFDPRVVALDVPRSKQARKVGDTTESALMYDFLEEMKNGNILVNKYESYTWRFARPHVIVTTNSYPDMKSLSHDRYHIITVSVTHEAQTSPPEPRVLPMFNPRPVADTIPGQAFPKLSKAVEEWAYPPGYNDFTAQRKLEWYHFSGAPVRDPHKKGPRHNASPREEDTEEDTNNYDTNETGSRAGATVIPPPSSTTEQTSNQDSETSP